LKSGTAALAKDLRAQRDRELKECRGNTRDKQRIHSEWDLFINTEIIDYLEENADFDVPKVHIISHFAETIEQYGTLLQFCTSVGERNHIEQVKEAYRHSNRSTTFENQVIDYNIRHHSFQVRELNKRAIHCEDSAIRQERASQPQVDLASPFFTRTDHPPPHRIENIATLNEYIGIDCFYSELRRYCETFYRETFSDRFLSRCCAYVYHQITIAVTEHGTENAVQQHVRCTGNVTWHNQPPRRDWVWKKCEGKASHGILHGSLPVRLRLLFRFQVDGLGYSGSHKLAFVENTIPINRGKPDADSGLVRVQKPVDGTGFSVIDIESLTGAAQCIPDCPKDPVAKQKSWVVNSHVDLETWNTVYAYQD
jgi:hypothetical protein